MWFSLSGLLVLAYSYNGILNLSCTHSLDKQKEQDKKAEEMMTEFESQNNTKPTKV